MTEGKKVGDHLRKVSENNMVLTNPGKNSDSPVKTMEK